jgi:hypothetical protein
MNSGKYCFRDILKPGEDVMSRCRKCIHLFVAAFMLVIFCQPLFAAEDKKKDKNEDYSDDPWETAGLYLGGYLATLDSSLSLRLAGVGAKVDAEDALGLNSDSNVFRGDAFWRISRRNRMDFLYYDLSRDSKGFLGVQIPDGEGGTIPIGTNIKTKFDFRLFKATWAYSFFKDDRFDLAAGIGAYVLDVDFKIDADGEKVQDTEFTLPLPVIALKGSFALTPKLILRQHVDWFYVEIGDFTGNIVDAGVYLEYNFWKYLGAGLGYNSVYMKVSHDDDDFLSEIEMRYSGLQLYAKGYF